MARHGPAQLSSARPGSLPYPCHFPPWSTSLFVLLKFHDHETQTNEVQCCISSSLSPPPVPLSLSPSLCVTCHLFFNCLPQTNWNSFESWRLVTVAPLCNFLLLLHKTHLLPFSYFFFSLIRLIMINHQDKKEFCFCFCFFCR